LPYIIGVNESRGVSWSGHVRCLGQMINVYNILFGKHERKRPFGRPKHKWEDNSVVLF
jgi:hypothetical protein